MELTPLRIPAVPYDYYVMTEACPQAILPRAGTYYILARNGVFLHKGNVDPDDDKEGLIESVTRVMEPPTSRGNRGFRSWNETLLPEPPGVLPGLLDCETYANVKISQIPHFIAVLAQSFFARVLREMRSESEVQLYYSLLLDRFELVCPEQMVSGGGVDYLRESTNLLVTAEGKFHRVGTIHSHCDFMAFHSGTDTADEEYEDGIHITFGHNDQPAKGRPLSVVASLVSNNHRFPMDPVVCIGGLSHVPVETVGGWWNSGRETQQFFILEPLIDSLEQARVLETVLGWLPRVRRDNFWGRQYRKTRQGKRTRVAGTAPPRGIGGSDESIN